MCCVFLSQEFDRQVTAVLQSYQDKLTERTANHMGYPYNLDFDYGALAGLERFSINNLGDPFIESNYGVHSREFEVRSARDFVHCHSGMCCVLASHMWRVTLALYHSVR